MTRDLRNAVTGTNVSLMKFNLQSGAAGTNYGSNVFFLASLPPSAQEAGSKSDVCEVGFFLALDRTAASTNRTLNLYRYFRSSNQTFSNMISGSLFTNISTGAAGEELLARNVVGMKIAPVSSSGGDWIPFVPRPEAPLPEMIEITLVTIGHDVAQKLEDLDRWTDTNFASHEAGCPKLHHASQRGKEAVRRRGNKAASLITTLLVIVVLSTVVVAFLQSTSLDRLTAKSAKNVLQAELSARAGLQSAISQLLTAAGTNNGFVTGSTNFSPSNAPVVVIGRTNLSDPQQIMPLVSIAPNLLESFLQSGWTDSLSILFADMAGTNSTDVNGRSGIIQSTNISYRAPWVEISSSSGERIGRYAFVVLDEDARVNPLLHTGTGTMSDPLAWYSGPNDISLTNASAPILTPDEQARVLSISNLVFDS